MNTMHFSDLYGSCEYGLQRDAAPSKQVNAE